MAKYTEEIKNRIVELMEKDSYTIKELCNAVNINVDTFYQWKNNKPEFAEAIKKATETFDAEMLVEAKRSLRNLICGYDYTETQKTMVGKGEMMFVKEHKEIKKHIAPNLGAIIHFQTNADPDNWKNRRSTDITTGGKTLYDTTQLTPEQAKARLAEIENDL